MTKHLPSTQARTIPKIVLGLIGLMMPFVVGLDRHHPRLDIAEIVVALCMFPFVVYLVDHRSVRRVVTRLRVETTHPAPAPLR